jgi:hypothetical protein
MQIISAKTRDGNQIDRAPPPLAREVSILRTLDQGTFRLAECKFALAFEPTFAGHVRSPPFRWLRSKRFAPFEGKLFATIQVA